MGHPTIRTPHIDALAEQSLVFTRGYVPASLCRPSLATIATGLYPHQHQITGNDPAPPDGYANGRWSRSPERFAANEPYVARMAELPTIARILGEAGYLSHQSGKWWESDFRTGGFTHGMTHGERERGGRHGDDGLKIGRQGMGPIFEFIDHAVNENRPFFLWYAPILPHTPHNPPDRILANYANGDRPIELAKYYAMVEWFDETCGALLDYLKQAGVAENTLVLFVADNGWIQATPDTELPAGWPRGGYAPRSKRSPHEGGIRTPILVRWPGKAKPVRDDRTLASSIDLMPTILQAARVDPPENVPGISLFDRQALQARNAIFGEIHAHDMPGPIDEPLNGLFYRWVIEGDWKLIAPNPALPPESFINRVTDKHRGVELYHLAGDPHETENLAKKHPEKVRHLMQLLNGWLP